LGAVYPSDPDPTGNTYLDVLIFGGSWSPTPGAGATIAWTLAPRILTGGAIEPSLPFDAAGLAAIQGAMAAWEAVCDVDFVQVARGDANLRVALATPRQLRDLYDPPAPGVFGSAGLPDGTPGLPMRAIFNARDDVWNAAALTPGGYSFGPTVIHEFGHTLGLTHPFNPGPPEASFPGVDGDAGAGGRFGQAQGVYTLMSYLEPLSESRPPQTAFDRGFQATPMAFDIAAAQALYGVNRATGAGDDTYRLDTADAPGTAWRCLWDAGGVDTLSAAGATGDAVIDLRAAPLVGPHAGGFLSMVAGVLGGATIAHGVSIENAIGGSGDDTVTGNAAANRLDGDSGADRLDGRGGADTLVLDGDDQARGGAGRDLFLIEARPETGLRPPRLLDFTPGQDRIALSGEVFAEGDVTYDAETGRLRWFGGGETTTIAWLPPGLHLSAADIVIG